jgi:hypothetical protein
MAGTGLRPLAVSITSVSQVSHGVRFLRCVVGSHRAYRWLRCFGFAIAGGVDKFKRTCTVKYPPKRGNRRELPVQPASAYGSWRATWASPKAPCWRARAVRSGRGASRRQRAWRSRQSTQSFQPANAAALTMQERATRYTGRMAGVSERVLPHLETLPPSEILERARNVEQFDRFSRCNYGLDNQPPSSGPLSLNVLANHSAIQIVHAPAPNESQD